MHAPSKASCIAFALHKDVRIQAARPIGLWTTSVVSSIRDEEGLEEAVLLGGGLSDSFVRACVRAFVHALVEDSLTFTSMMLTRSVRSFCSIFRSPFCDPYSERFLMQKPTAWHSSLNCFIEHPRLLNTDSIASFKTASRGRSVFCGLPSMSCRAFLSSSMSRARRSLSSASTSRSR